MAAGPYCGKTLARYQTIIAQMQADPLTLFTLPSTTHRVLAYLAWCAPYSRPMVSIAYAANVYNARPFLLPLVQQGLIVRLGSKAGHYRYRLAPQQTRARAHTENRACL